ncbi:unnamed protein product [Chrysoparadoxa australica]
MFVAKGLGAFLLTATTADSFLVPTTPALHHAPLTSSLANGPPDLSDLRKEAAEFAAKHDLEEKSKTAWGAASELAKQATAAAIEANEKHGLVEKAKEAVAAAATVGSEVAGATYEKMKAENSGLQDLDAKAQVLESKAKQFAEENKLGEKADELKNKVAAAAAAAKSA